jgi:hypothetical protein
VSTKDISRSALEGGRNNGNKWERNESHRHERSRTKVWLDSVRFDDEAAEDSAPIPRNPVSKGFTDKLNPCYRWLASHCGQPWDDVFSKLASTFDTRKLSAWHIVNQHMLTDVQGAGTARDGFAGIFGGYHRFYIDDEGLLRDNGKRAWRNRKVEHKGPSKESVFAYAKGRKVFDYHSGFRQWALPGPGEWQSCKAIKGRCSISGHLHRKVETTPAALVEKYKLSGFRTLGEGDWWRTFAAEHFVSQSWRAHKKFTKAELKWWESISYDIRGLLYVPR